MTLLSLLLALTTPTAQACDCREPAPVTSAEWAQVLAGDVVSDDGDTVTIAVLEVWAGPVDAEVVLPVDDTSCGVFWTVGDAVLVATDTVGSAPHSCTPSGRLPSREVELCDLGPGEVPAGVSHQAGSLAPDDCPTGGCDQSGRGPTLGWLAGLWVLFLRRR